MSSVDGQLFPVLSWEVVEPFGVLYIFREPVLTSGQLSRLSNILDNAGNVLLAVFVLSPLVSSVDTIGAPMIFSGVVLTLILWGVSLWLARREENV